MSAKDIVMIGVAAAMVPAVQNAAIEEREPACEIEAALPDAAPLACPVKQPPLQHVERETLPPMYLPTVGATFTRSLSDTGPQPLGGLPLHI